MPPVDPAPPVPPAAPPQAGKISAKEIVQLLERMSTRIKTLEERNGKLELRVGELTAENARLQQALEDALQEAAVSRDRLAQTPASAAFESGDVPEREDRIPDAELPERPEAPSAAAIGSKRWRFGRVWPLVRESANGHTPSESDRPTGAWQPWAELRNIAALLLIALLHVATAALFLLNRTPGSDAALWSFPIDDAYIHLDYARQLATSGVLGYNDGIWEAGSTSPLWTLALAIAYRLLVLNGISVAIATKALGLAFAIGTSVVIYYLVRRISGRGILGFIVAGAIALEPTFSYHKVSGMEGTLFAFVVALAMLFLVQRRGWYLGITLGLIGWARPEGFVLLGLVCLVLVLDVVWRHVFASDSRQARWEFLLQVLLPVILLVGLWVGYNFAINGTPYPNTYLVKHDFSLGLFNLENLLNVWSGYNSLQPFFASVPATVGSLALFAAGAYYIVRRLGLFGVPLALFPWTVWYSLSLMMKWSDAPWSFWTRRYADPAVPFLIMVAAIGFLFILNSCSRLAKLSSLPAQGMGKALAAVGMILLVGLAVLPLQRVPEQWLEYPVQYAWNSQNIEEVDAAAGRWINEYTAPDVVVATVDAGAVRYFGNRLTIDLVGLSFRKAVGRPYFDVVREFKPEYVFAFQSGFERSIPNAEPVLVLKPERNTILGGAEAVLMKMDWTWQPEDKTVPKTLDTSGLQLLDKLDIGEVKELADEKAHSYKDTNTAGIVDTWSKLTNSYGIADKGRIHPPGATGTFAMGSAQGKDLILVLRYDALRQSDADVYVGDRYVGRWMLSKGLYALSEDQFVIPASLVGGDTVNLRLEWQTGVSDFYYWTYVKP